MDSNNDNHTMDQWELDQRKAQEEADKKAIIDSSLIFSVFSTPQGQKLLDKWTETLMFTPGAKPGMDQIQVGLIEGEKAFVRSIKNAVKLHEAQ